MSLVAFAGGFFGGLNKIAAEKRAAEAETLASQASTNTELLKYYRGLTTTSEGKKTISTPGWLDNNFPIVQSLGDPTLANSLAVLVNDIDDGNMRYGDNETGFFTINGIDDSYKPNSLEYSTEFLHNVENALTNPQNVTALRKLKESNNQQFKLFQSNFVRNAQNYVSLTRKARTPTEAENLTAVIPVLGEDFKILNDESVSPIFQNLLGKFHIEEMNKIINKTSGDKSGQGDSVFGYYYLNDEGNAYNIIGGEGSPLDFTNQPKRLEKLLEFSNKLNITPQEFIQNFGGIDKTLLGQSEEKNAEALAPLYVALDNKFIELKPERLYKNHDEHAQLSDSERYALGGKLSDLSLQGKISALKSFMLLDEDNPVSAANISQKTTGVAINKWYEDNTGYTIKEMKTQKTKLKSSVEKLKTLIELQKTTPTTAAANLISLIAGTVGESGFVAQLAGNTGWENEGLTASEQNDYDTTIEKYQNEIGVAYTMGEKIGRMASLRIALAFELARAADPSGRLSNQDIEVQLRRLGAGKLFVSQEESIATLEQTLDDTIKLEKYWNQFPSINGNEAITTEQKQTILASIAAYEIQQFYDDHKVDENGDIVQKPVGLLSADDQDVYQLQPSLGMTDTAMQSITPKDKIKKGQKVTLPLLSVPTADTPFVAHLNPNDGMLYVLQYDPSGKHTSVQDLGAPSTLIDAYDSDTNTLTFDFNPT